MVTVPALVTLQIPDDVVLKLTARVELAVAFRLKFAAVGSLSLNAPKVMFCNRRDVNERVTLGAAE
jgi:hypothetical protein